jgi:hypothetical protein
MQSRVDSATGAAVHGSQYQLQLYVNQHGDELSRQVIGGLSGIAADAQVRWVSPLVKKKYKEYWDARFLDSLDLTEFRKQLKEFWPRGGPHWDALAKIENVGRPGVVLVEAKAHSSEIYNKKGCVAVAASREVIEASLRRTCEWLKIAYGPMWTGSLYQSANRLAHLYFLREIAKVDAWLVNIYFLDDRGYKATSREEWTPAIAKVKAELGIANIEIPYARDLFLAALAPHI